MLVEIAQIDIKQGDKGSNMNKIMDIINNSRGDLILFPELFTTGFAHEECHELAESLENSETVNQISDIAEDKLIAGSIIEVDNYRLYNTFLLIDDTGIIGKYRKIHLFDKERDVFTPGKDICVVNTEHGRMGLAVCYDLRFPELFREFMKNNAEIILICANFPSIRRSHWDILLKARAIENQFFIIACNRVGRDDYNEYSGRSMVIDPWGRSLTIGDDFETILHCNVDYRRVGEIRESFPVLEHVRLLE